MLAIVSKICMPWLISAGAEMRVELPRDDDALDFGRAFINLRDLRVSEQPLNGIFLYIAVAAEDLDRLRRHPHRRFARHQFCHRAKLLEVLSSIAGGGGGV